MDATAFLAVVFLRISLSKPSGGVSCSLSYMHVLQATVVSVLASNILIFDSGVGGLSVFQEIRRCLPAHNYIYLFDNEAYPYGELSQNQLLFRVEMLVLGMVKKQDIDLVIIACNTASTIVLPMLRNRLAIPVVGVVPAIKPACSLAQEYIGLIATPATINRTYTHDLIRNFAGEKNVLLLGSTRLVDLAEEKLRGKSIDVAEIRDILKPLQDRIDVAVLGCTHFPLIKQEIQQVLGAQVLLVDSGQAIARRVLSLLKSNMCRHPQRKPQMYSSALPRGKRALNKSLKCWGFNQIVCFPIQDVSDHLQYAP
jgi:glutamate racemase